MTKSFSDDIVTLVTTAGIRYLPADQIYYKEFPYKVEMGPLYKGFGTRRKLVIDIDPSLPDKGRIKLAEYIERAEKMFLNVEHRNEIVGFLNGLTGFTHYRRMGGENSLIYLKDASVIMKLIETFPNIVNSVTGPINDEHRAVFDEQRNVVMREKLFYDQFRFQLKFNATQEFADNCQSQLIQALNEKDPNSWRAHRLNLNFKNNKNNLTTRVGTPIYYRPYISHRPQNVILYLKNAQDFVHIKLLGAEYIESFQEIMLFDELN